MNHNMTGSHQATLDPYIPIQQVRDPQPIRATCFHPSGETYVVGSNSKALRICRYPNAETIRLLLEESLDSKNYTNQSQSTTAEQRRSLPAEPEISFTCLHIHCGSVYCAAFNPTGDLLATGSNDQIVHLIKYNSERHAPEGSEYKLAIHSGTVRDVCFLAPPPPTTDEWARSPSQQAAKTNLLASAGAGEFEVNVSDCNVMKCIRSFHGHESVVMSLHSSSSSSDTFVSGSLDGTIRLWDLRCKTCVSVITSRPAQRPALTTDGDEPIGQLKIKQENNLNESLNDIKPNVLKQQQENRAPQEASENGFNHYQVATNGTTTTIKGTPVGCVRLESSGRLLVSGHQDGTCMLYDIRAGKALQQFQAHKGEIRTLNISPKSYYLLTGGYDCKVKLMDLQGQLTSKLPSVEVAELDEKCVQTAWHPYDYNFVTTCADGSATLWTIPNFDQWIDSSLTAN